MRCVCLRSPPQSPPDQTTLCCWLLALNFGFRRTLPHTLGHIRWPFYSVGFRRFRTRIFIYYFSSTTDSSKDCRIGLYAYLAARIATSRSLSQKKNSQKGDSQEKDQTESIETKPFTVIEAMLFQWVNPKVWVMAVSGISPIQQFTAASQIHIDSRCSVFSTQLAVRLYLGSFWQLTAWIFVLINQAAMV